MGTALAASKSLRTECIWLHSKASVTGTYTDAMIRDSFSYTMTVMGMDSDLKNSGTSVHIEWAAYGYGYIGFRYKLLKDGSNKLEKNGTISSSKGFSTNSCYVCVKLARAIVSNSSLLLADEPTGALDSKTSEEIMACFEEIHKSGRTIIMVTHDNKVAQHADRIIHIEDGTIVD